MFTHVFALDFDAVSTAGTYTISVSGSISASSPSFRIDTGANLYSTSLANTLYFYQNQRDGANFIATPLRTAAGHLNDQSAKVYFTPTMNRNGHFPGDLTPTGAVIDASGGWWDAGDYLKFVETHSYTVDLMLVGVRDFPNQMGAGSAASNFTAEAKFGLDWLQRMWDDNSERFTTKSGSGMETHRPPAITTSGGCRKRTTTIKDAPRNSATSAIGPFSSTQLAKRQRRSART